MTAQSTRDALAGLLDVARGLTTCSFGEDGRPCLDCVLKLGAALKAWDEREPLLHDGEMVTEVSDYLLIDDITANGVVSVAGRILKAIDTHLGGSTRGRLG